MKRSMQTMGEDRREFKFMGNDNILLKRQNDPHRPVLENRVAYQWESHQDMLEYRNNIKRDNIILKWLAEAVRSSSQPVAVLDVGCAYGNMLLLLNALLNKPSNVELIGVDIYEESLEFGRAFAERVPGYRNCKFQVADLSHSLPFDDATFGVISICDVLEHMENPRGALKEIIRVAKPDAVVIICTPLRNSAFKILARAANYLSGGRLFKLYYTGKGAELDKNGKPIMPTKAGSHGHISEMSWKELKELVIRSGLEIEQGQMMPIMIGSRLFDKHGFLLSALLFLEAMHDVLQRPSWAHSVCMKLKVPTNLKKGINND